MIESTLVSILLAVHAVEVSAIGWLVVQTVVQARLLGQIEGRLQSLEAGLHRLV